MKHRVDDWRPYPAGVSHCSLCPCQPEAMNGMDREEFEVEHPTCETMWIDETERFLLALTTEVEW